jgi:hypothetical protein
MERRQALNQDASAWQFDGFNASLACVRGQLALQRAKPGRARGCCGRAERPAEEHRLRETTIGARGPRHADEDPVEVALQQVLEQACGDGRPEIRVGRAAPALREGPYRLRLALDELPDGDDRLPPRIALALRGGLAGQQQFSLRDCVLNIHPCRQANAQR